MTIKEVAGLLHEWAPPELAESYDNVGVLVGEPGKEAKKILVSLEVTEQVLDEAANLGANVVVSHHPLWFRNRKSLLGDDYVSRNLLKAIRYDVALIAIHTNLDNVYKGVNAKIGEKLGLRDFQILKPKSPDNPQIGSGMIGAFGEAMKEEEFLAHIKSTFLCGSVKYTKAPLVERFEKIAWCGGAGSFLIEDAARAGADAYITSDITYHLYFDAPESMMLIDVGHYESEQYTVELIAEYLKERTENRMTSAPEILVSTVNTNPVNYYI